MSSIPIRPLEVIRETIASIPAAEAKDEQFKAGTVLTREGECYEHIGLVIHGEIELSKRDEEGDAHYVGRLRPGQFLGLLLLSSGEPSFLTARAKTDGSMLVMPQDRFRELLYTHREFYEMVGPLMLGNLVSRYRRVVRLHLDVAELTDDLEAEKRHLQEIIRQLEATRNQLVQQEKMATLGQLVAGIAHEINNPIASLSRAADSIEPQTLRFFTAPTDAKSAGLLHRAFESGLNRKTLQTEVQRERLDVLQARFPDLPRTLIRTLAQIEPDVFEELAQYVHKEPTQERKALVRRWVDVFEAGTLIRNMRVAAARIGRMVRSLKGYSRQDKAELDDVDLREGLHDTLVLFGYVLKRFQVEVDLPEIPPVRCRPSELNQVWTNLILNACQAMGESGSLKVTCGKMGDRMIYVNIQDSGPGVPESLKQRIFESGFSTKGMADKEGAGLGLGLSIAKGIVEKHGGRIEVENVAGGGAAFTVFLPTGGA